MVLFERIRTGGLIGGCVSLEVGFEGSKAQARLSSPLLFLLLADPDVELCNALSAFCALILPTMMTVD